MTTESASESVSQFVSQIREEMKTDNPEVLAEEVEEEATAENPGKEQEFPHRSVRGTIPIAPITHPTCPLDSQRTRDSNK